MHTQQIYTDKGMEVQYGCISADGVIYTFYYEGVSMSSLATSLKTMICFFLSLSISYSQNPTVNSQTPITNGFVQSIKVDGTTTYIAGEFDYIGHATASSLRMNTQGDVLNFPFTDGAVFAVAEDGSGGYYIGGSFTHVGTFECRGLAHIYADNTVDQNFDFRVNEGGSVNSLAVDGTGLYIGGNFSSINAQTAHNIAGIDIVSNNFILPICNLLPNGEVFSVCYTDGYLFVGGNFTQIGGFPHAYCAMVHWLYGISAPHNLNLTGPVRSILRGGGHIFIGGSFTAILGSPRSGVASFSVPIDQYSSPVLTPWTYNIDGHVYSLFHLDNMLYVGGAFTMANGQARRNFAVFGAGNGNLQSYNPSPDATVLTIHGSFNGGFVVIGGWFREFAGQPRRHLARISRFDNTLENWGMNFSAPVTALLANNSSVFIGGAFKSYGGQNRRNIASFNVETGEISQWQPTINGAVNAIEIINNTVYCGGLFSEISGQTRNYIGAIDKTTGNVLPWSPVIDGNITALVKMGDILYMSGNFTEINGTERLKLAAIHSQNGQLQSLNIPIGGDGAHKMEIHHGYLWINGGFWFVGGLERPYLAKINLANSQVTNFRVNTYGFIKDFYVRTSDVLLCGYFSEIDNNPRNYVAQVDISNGSLYPWNPVCNNFVTHIQSLQGKIYITGYFTNIGGLSRRYCASFDDATLQMTSYNPMPNEQIENMVNVGDYMFMNSVNGDYYDGVYKPNLVIFSDAPSVSQESFITHSSDLSPLSNIDYKRYRRINNYDIFSPAIAKFLMRDGGIAGDADSYATILNSLSFSVTNYEVLDKIAIVDQFNHTVEVKDAAPTVIFNSPQLQTVFAADDDNTYFTVQVTFKSSVTDRTQFAMEIINATTTVNSSRFASTDAGNARTLTGGDINRINVIATKLRFVQQPINAIVNVPVTNPVIVQPMDSLNNVDTELVGQMVELVNDKMTVNPQLQIIDLNHTATFSNFMFHTSGTNEILWAAMSGVGMSESNQFSILETPADAIIHFEAGAVNMPDGSSVDMWNNSATLFDNAEQTIAARQPWLRTLPPFSINALPVIVSDNGKGMQFMPSTELQMATAKTIMAVIQTTTTFIGTQTIIELGNLKEGLNMYIFANRLYAGVWQNGIFRSASVPINSQSVYLVQMVYNGSSIRLSLTPANQGTIAANTTFGVPASITIPGNSWCGVAASQQSTRFHNRFSFEQFANSFRGSIAEILVLNTDDYDIRTNVYNTLVRKYQLQNSPQPLLRSQATDDYVSDQQENGNNENMILPNPANDYAIFTVSGNDVRFIKIIDINGIVRAIVPTHGEAILFHSLRYEQGVYSVCFVNGADEIIGTTSLVIVR